jgi:hypothetical protein
VRNLYEHEPPVAFVLMVGHHNARGDAVGHVRAEKRGREGGREEWRVSFHGARLNKRPWPDDEEEGWREGGREGEERRT